MLELSHFDRRNGKEAFKRNVDIGRSKHPTDAGENYGPQP